MDAVDKLGPQKYIPESQEQTGKGRRRIRQIFGIDILVQDNIGLVMIQVRHIIDHVWAFQEGINTGVIDYNLRHRDTCLERDPQLALQALDDFVTWLNQAPNNNVELTVITEISVSHCESISTPSNSHRELAYLVNHALHHIAYANVLAKSIGLQPADYLGVAPATATYQREQNKTCAQ